MIHFSKVVLVVLLLFPLGAAHRGRSGGDDLQSDGGRNCSSRQKLVVNSHVDYAQAVSKLVESLERVNFTLWGDVVVFRGGAEQNSRPQTDARGITYVNLTINSYDFNALSGLYQYRHEPSVCAHSYLYILDTVEFGEYFPQAFDELRLEPGEQLMSPRPNSNILAFDHGLVGKYGTNFDRAVTKQEAVQIETGALPLPGVHRLEHFAAKVTMTVNREEQGHVDLYHTGHPRTKFYYPSFGIYKYILWDQMGDLGGDGEVKPIYPPR
uniref:Uncharacterized protein n=1 Tax=Alexandrium catenella TaxID=2925 RepID=A0A7S1Q903_ALECA|mmetsp:Transcript_21012/g.57410  ORF Transcript_21012/g.57410 Transcript_21012/m.57410 type:complete len:267 (+) Transcript_21012:101-901(+)